MEKLHSLPKQILESEDAMGVQEDYDRLVVEMNQFEKATVEVPFNAALPQSQSLQIWERCLTLNNTPLCAGLV